MVCTFSGLLFILPPLSHFLPGGLHGLAGVSRVQVLLLERFAFAEEDGERGRA
jgi:hypothetical protein